MVLIKHYIELELMVIFYRFKKKYLNRKRSLIKLFVLYMIYVYIMFFVWYMGI